MTLVDPYRKLLLKCQGMSGIESLWNLSPLKIVVSKKFVSLFLSTRILDQLKSFNTPSLHFLSRSRREKRIYKRWSAVRLLRTNPSETKFEENICNFKSNVRVRGYPEYLVNKVLAEVKFTNIRSALEQKPQVLSRSTTDQCPILKIF